MMGGKVKRSQRSWGGAIFNGLGMLFARQYKLALIRLGSYLVLVCVFYLLLRKGLDSSYLSLLFVLVLALAVFWFVYGGMKAHRWFETDETLNKDEQSIFLKLFNRFGFVTFVFVIIYLLVVGLMLVSTSFGAIL